MCEIERSVVPWQAKASLCSILQQCIGALFRRRRRRYDRGTVIWARFNRCQKNWRNKVRAESGERMVTNLVHQCSSTTPRITTNYHSTIVDRKHEKQVAGPSHCSQGARCSTEINTDVEVDMNYYVARHSLVYAPLP